MYPHQLSHNGVVWEIGGEYPDRFKRLEDIIAAAETRAPKLTEAYWNALACGLFLNWIVPYQSEADAAIARTSQQMRSTRHIEKCKQADSWREETYAIKPDQKERAKWYKVLRAERW